VIDAVEVIREIRDQELDLGYNLGNETQRWTLIRQSRRKNQEGGSRSGKVMPLQPGNRCIKDDTYDDGKKDQQDHLNNSMQKQIAMNRPAAR